MDTAPSDHPGALATDRAFDIVQGFLGQSMPSDDSPLPPGPWDPVIRALLAHPHIFGPGPDHWLRFGAAMGPSPDPWRAAFAASAASERMSLGEVFGPQPEPWRRAIIAIIARQHPEIWEVVGGWGRRIDEVALNPQPLPPRWAFMAALAAAAAQRAELIADLGRATGSEGGAGRYVVELADDFCGNGRIPWPWPWPRPNWLVDEIGPADLVIVASVFSAASRRVLDGGLREGLEAASAKLAETGTARLG